MKKNNLRSSLVFVMLLGCFWINTHAVTFELFVDPAFSGVVTTDPYLGNADDTFFSGLNTLGATSQYFGTYGSDFLSGTFEAISLFDGGFAEQLDLGDNEILAINYSAPSGLFNPMLQVLDPLAANTLTVNQNQTFTTSFILNDSIAGGRLQVNGTGQYLFQYQAASNHYTGDVLTHFDTIVPLLPEGWGVVAQETQTWTVLDGPNAGDSATATLSFFSNDRMAFIPRNLPSPLGPPWVVSGYASEDIDLNVIEVGGDASRNGDFVDGTASLSNGQSVTGKELLIGFPLAASGNVLVTGPGTRFLGGLSATVRNGSLSVEMGAEFDIDNAASPFMRPSGVAVVTNLSRFVADGADTIVRVRNGELNVWGNLLFDGVDYNNYFTVIEGGSAEVRNGAQVSVEGVESSIIQVGGLLTDGTSRILVDGDDSLLASQSLIIVGGHPTFDNVFGAEPLDKGILEVSDGGVAEANRIYIHTPGVVTGSNGTLRGFVENHGTVSPGSSPGTLYVVGDYEQAPEGKLIIEIAGIADGQFDVLDISGTATLGGTLEIILLDGFVPSDTDIFDFILAGAGLVGAFEQIIAPTFGNNQTLGIGFGANGLFANVVAAPVPIPGGFILLGSGLIGLFLRRRRA